MTQNIYKRFGHIEHNRIVKGKVMKKETWFPFIKEVTENYNSIKKKKEDILIRIHKTHAGLKKLAKKTSTCLKGKSREFYQHNAEDPGTIYVGTYADGKIIRYTRLFFIENKNTEKIELVKDYSSPFFSHLYSLKSATLLYTILLAQELGASLKHPAYYGYEGDGKFSIEKIGFAENIKCDFIHPGFVINTYLKTIWDKKEYEKNNV